MRKYGRNTYLNEEDLIQEVFAERVSGSKRNARWIMIDALRRSYPMIRHEIYQNNIEDYGNKLTHRFNLILWLDLCMVLNFTNGKRRDIVWKLINGWTQREIASDYGCNETNISFYLRKIRKEVKNNE